MSDKELEKLNKLLELQIKEQAWQTAHLSRLLVRLFEDEAGPGSPIEDFVPIATRRQERVRTAVERITGEAETDDLK